MKNLKNIALVCILLLSPLVSVWADEPDSSDFLWISKDLYFVHRDQIYTRTEYQYGDLRGEVDNASGKVYSFKTIEQNINEKLGYGITDRLNLFLIGEYVPTEKRTDDFTNGSRASYSFDGFSNPAVAIAYRAINEGKNSPVFLDLHATYAPDWVKAKASSSTYGSGNVALGGDHSNAEVDLSRLANNFMAKWYIGGDYYSVEKLYDQGDTGYSREDGHFAYYSGLEFEKLFPSRFSVDAGAKYWNEEHGIGETESDGAAEKFNPGSEYIFNAGLNYSLLPHNALLELYYNYYLFDNAHHIFPDATASNFIYKNEHSNIYGAALRYVF